MRPRPRLLFASGLFVAGLGALAACGSSATRECRIGADCVSGVCSAEGTCLSAADPSSPDVPGAPGVDASTPETPAPVDAALPGCVPNFDGTIVREEVPLRAGLKATYRVAANADVSTAGSPGPNGTRVWDFSAPLPNDESVVIETLPLTNKWYASKFDGAAYATKLRASSTLEGVFDTGPGAITLRGVASPSDGFTRTELTNDPPVAVLSFPLTVGKTWTDDTTVSGLAQGVVAAYGETYESTVDARGTLKTPLGTFDVLRVRVLLTRTVGLLVTRIRTFAFVSECYGTVAMATSLDDEPNVEFTHALEIRRIAP